MINSEIDYPSKVMLRHQVCIPYRKETWKVHKISDNDTKPRLRYATGTREREREWELHGTECSYCCEPIDTKECANMVKIWNRAAHECENTQTESLPQRECKTLQEAHGRRSLRYSCDFGKTAWELSMERTGETHWRK